MAASVRLMRRYVWLVETIRRAGRISLDEINSRWLSNYALNPDHEAEIPERTFHRHREAVSEMFGIEISCDRASNTYCIKDDSALLGPSFTNWLFNGLALDNELMSNEGVKRKILFEDTPGGVEHRPAIIEALSTNHVLRLRYRSYNNPVETEWEIEPCGMKQYRRRWYVIGCKVGEDSPLTFALDRIISLQIADRIFEPDNGEDVNSLFSEVVGVFVDPDLDVEDVVVRVYGRQRNYFEGTPLHHSQTIIARTSDYTDYRFRLRPEYEFQHEILRLGPDAEVLSPQWLRGDMKWYAEESLKRYK